MAVYYFIMFFVCVLLGILFTTTEPGHKNFDLNRIIGGVMLFASGMQIMMWIITVFMQTP